MRKGQKHKILFVAFTTAFAAPAVCRFYATTDKPVTLIVNSCSLRAAIYNKGGCITTTRFIESNKSSCSYTTSLIGDPLPNKGGCFTTTMFIKNNKHSCSNTASLISNSSTKGAITNKGGCIVNSYSSREAVNNTASLIDVLHIAKLLEAFNECESLLKTASNFLAHRQTRDAFNVLHTIWRSDVFIPALLLAQCYKARQLIFPAWKKVGRFYVHYLAKPDGDFRTILVADLRYRVCMGVVNRLLQSSCLSWSNYTVGFRPGYGTLSAMQLLATSAKKALNAGSVVIVTLDLQKAFNSVLLPNLFNTLQLQGLPGEIKRFLWLWQHTPVVLPSSTNLMGPGLTGFQHTDKIPEIRSGAVLQRGLSQGFAYSPTLFAWYLDIVLANKLGLIAYADNFAQAYSSLEECKQKLQEFHACAKEAGLYVNPNSIQIHVINNAFNTGRVEWLGHVLNLPDCSIVPARSVIRSTPKEPTIMSFQQWELLLRKTRWVKKVSRRSLWTEI